VEVRAHFSNRKWIKDISRPLIESGLVGFLDLNTTTEGKSRQCFQLFALKKEWRSLPSGSRGSGHGQHGASHGQNVGEGGAAASAGASADEEADGEEGDGEDPDIAKIKKVQSFFRYWKRKGKLGGNGILCNPKRVSSCSRRGWLCRRRWKQIVEEYIRSPHAESMRKRNWYE